MGKHDFVRRFVLSHRLPIHDDPMVVDDIDKSILRGCEIYQRIEELLSRQDPDKS